MKTTGNTILITGGGSGIGRGLATAFAADGNYVIIAGRRRSALDAVVAATRGITATELDVADPASIAAVVPALLRDYPELNVVVHCAGIMRPEDLKDGNIADAEATVATNLLGPIRLTAALIHHLLAQPAATIVTISAGLAFVPMAPTPTYNATKAAIHSYSETLREQLKATSVEVLEIIPPYVQSALLGSDGLTDEHAMPVADFIAQTMDIIRGGAAHEISVEQVKPLRNAEANGTYQVMFEKNNAIFA